MAYRNGGKPDVEELPMRRAVRWHRVWTAVLSVAWLSWGAVHDAGAYGSWPTTTLVSFVLLGLASFVLAFVSTELAMKGRW